MALSASAAASAVAAVQLEAAAVPAQVAFLVTVVASGVGGYFAWLALVPRTLPNEDRKASLIYFGALARRDSSSSVLAELRGQSGEDALLDFTHQMRELSLIADEKFKQVDRSINSVAGAAVVLVVGLVVKACASG